MSNVILSNTTTFSIMSIKVVKQELLCLRVWLWTITFYKTTKGNLSKFSWTSWTVSIEWLTHIYVEDVIKHYNLRQTGWSGTHSWLSPSLLLQRTVTERVTGHVGPEGLIPTLIPTAWTRGHERCYLVNLPPTWIDSIIKQWNLPCH